MRILNHHVPTATVLLVVYEAVAVTASVYLAAVLRFGWGPLPTDARPLWPKALAFAVILVLGIAAMGLYQAEHQRLSREAIVARILVAFGLAALVQTAVFYGLPDEALGRGIWGIGLALSFVLVICGRAFVARVVNADAFRRRVLVYGAGNMAAALLRLRRRTDQRGFKVIAFLPAPGDQYVIDDGRVNCSGEDVVAFVKEHDIDEIVVAMDDKRGGFPLQELLECKFEGVDVVDILAFLERESGRLDVERLNPSWLIFSEGFTTRYSRRIAARLLDIVGGVMLLLVFWPFMLLIALAILIEDGRPIFYRQTRVGLLGRPFELLKFRSMNKQAESAGEARWAVKNDVRVTKTGRIIRKFRLDELPQIFNIIRGQMSLVGPRPERPEFVAELSKRIPYYHQRHSVKPGLTGWAQLRYSYGASEQDALEKLRYDLYYVKNQSLWLDLVILLQTAEVVLWQKGSR